jgi:hypothetical protein
MELAAPPMQLLLHLGEMAFLISFMPAPVLSSSLAALVATLAQQLTQQRPLAVSLTQLRPQPEVAAGRPLFFKRPFILAKVVKQAQRRHQLRCKAVPQMRPQ